MFWTVLRFDFKNLVRDRGAWVALLGFVLLAAYASLSGARLAAAEVQDHAASHSAQRQRFEALKQGAQAAERGAAVRANQDPRDPHLVGRDLGRVVATLPHVPLSNIAVGQRDLLPQAIVVTSEARLGDAGAEDSGSLARRVNGAFDLAFVLVYLFPLVVISLTFDLLGAERERGTLAMVLAQPISVGRYCALKALSRGLCLGGVLISSAFLLPWLLAGAGDLASAVLYLALLLSYLGFWLLLAVWVNSVGKTSAGNALTLITLWLGLVVLLPGFAGVVVDTLHPSPSRVALVNEARRATQQAEAEVSAIEGDHGQPAQGVGALGSRAAQVQTELEGRLAPVVESFGARLAEQQALVDRLRFISPAIVAFEGMNDLAGSGVRRHQDFEAQVKQFHKEYKAFYFAKVRAGQPLASADHASLPAFEYREAGSGAMLRRVGSGIASLVAACLLLGVAAARRLRRYLSHGLR